MTIKIINISSPRNAVFNESNQVSINYDVISDINNYSLNNNTSDKFSYFQKNNSKHVKLLFDYKDIPSNESFVTENKFDEMNKSYVDVKNIEPYNESNRTLNIYDKKLVTSNLGSVRSTSGNVLKEKNVNNAFIDKVNPVHSNNLLLEDFDHPEFDYVFSFNYSDFYFRGGRIDAFSNISKIKMTEDSIAKLKGFRENGLGKGKSAFKLNNVINQFYRKTDDVTFHFEDNIDSVYLTNNIKKRVIQRLNYVWDFNTGIYSEDSANISVFKQIHSQEARYFAFKESNLQPFNDKTSKENDSNLSKNIYKFTDIDINAKILLNKSKNDNIIEDILYSAHGRDINKESNSGRDSIGFYESID